jgi:putative ABC transport system permease protein
MFNFYHKLLIRQLRNRTMRLFCIAVAIACAVTFSITLLGDRLEQLFNLQAKEVLAADMVLQSSTELSDQQKSILQSLTINEAKTLTFQTMASTENDDAFLLSSVKAVSNDYPLIGELHVSNDLYSELIATKDIPAIGEAWVEDRVLNQLDLTINQFINVGETSLQVTRVLVYEPDRGNSFYSFTPRIMMNWNDVAATQVVKPGSRVKFRYLFAGEKDQLNKLQTELTDTLRLNQKFVTVEDANQTLSTTLERAYRFLNITALIAVLLGAVAAGLVSFHYANEMTYQYALLRCLGLQSKNMMGAVIIPLVVFTLIAIGIGLVIGGVGHWLILRSLADLIPETLPLPSIKPFLLSAATAIIVVISFAWPFLYKLLHTAPKTLLNRLEVQEQPIKVTLLMIALGLSCLIYIGTQDVVISVYIIAVLCVFVVFTYFVTYLAIALIGYLSKNGQASIKLTARRIKSNQRLVVVQVIAIALTFFSLALLSTVRDDLVSSWQSKVPENAPNIFAINIFEKDKPEFLLSLDEFKIDHSPLYPIVRGRLSAVNNVLIQQYASQESERHEESLTRDLALTWNLVLPKDNEIIEGEWHTSKFIDQANTVSIEQGIAENLAIKLGDTLAFTIETQTVSAVVTSIRSVEWESFSPNFYMMFSTGALDELPMSYMTSLRIDKQQKTILPTLVKLFPSATFFDVDFLLNRIRGITQKISYAVETVLYFALLSSFLVFISIEMILRKHRIYSMAIFKAVGADTKLIQKIFRIEFILIGLISGVIAYILNLCISFGITNYIIDGDVIFNVKTAFLCLVIAPVIVLIAGYVSVFRTRQVSVIKLLSDQ